MRRFVIMILAAGSLALSLWTFNAVADTAASTGQKEVLVNLYASPSTEHIVKQLAPNTRLIPIYQQDNWVKVGNPKNGEIGWINMVQYQKARLSYYQPDIQTLYVHMDFDKGKRPTLNVIAYKNGKQLSPDQAVKIYERLRKQQQAQLEDMQRFTISMQHMMNQDFLNTERFFDSAWLNPSWMAPVVLVPAAVQSMTKNMPHKSQTKSMTAAPKQQ